MDATTGRVEDTTNDHSQEWSGDIDISQLCRVCACTNEYLIPIFQGEGLEHELENKIKKHLPLSVSESDSLPLHLCYQCASTLIAWNDLVITCIESEEKFKQLVKLPEELDNIQSGKSCNKENEAESQPSNNAELFATVVKPGDTIIFQPADAICDNPMGDTSSMLPIINSVSSIETGSINEVPSNTRCVANFTAYHQIQTALRMLEWVGTGCVFCVLCGEEKQNSKMLITHVNTVHIVRCGHCCAYFANHDQLSSHLTRHHKKILKYCETPLVSHLETKMYNATMTSSDCPFQCDICPSIFARRFELKCHKLKHHSKEVISAKPSSNSSSKCEEVEMVYVNDNIDGNNGSGPNLHNNNGMTHTEDSMSADDDSVTSEDISRHVDVNKVNCGETTIAASNYYCSLCDHHFWTKEEIIHHQEKLHNDEKTGKDFKQSVSEKEVSNKQFSCSLCKTQYSKKSDLQKHINKKHSDEKIVRRCVDFVDDMDVKILNKAKLDINGTIVYQCSYCSKNMRTRRGFVRHIRIHTGERPFTCHICGKQYRTHTDLTRHLRCVHEGVKNYQCDICSRWFASRGTLNDHRRTHTGEKPYMCDICGKSFPTPNSIYVHRRVHTDYFPHSCTNCDKKFRRKQQLTHHFRTHTGEKPFGCELCGKCFCTKDEVSRHRLTHSQDKPHVCPVCGVRFGQKRYLTNHMKTNHVSCIAPRTD